MTSLEPTTTMGSRRVSQKRTPSKKYSNASVKNKIVLHFLALFFFVVVNKKLFVLLFTLVRSKKVKKNNNKIL